LGPRTKKKENAKTNQKYIRKKNPKKYNNEKRMPEHSKKWLKIG
jgi:hypothetical protein